MLLDALEFSLLLMPFAFFWVNCPCCEELQTCDGWCPGGAPAQWQLTIPDPTWDAGTDTLHCDDEQCNERIGEFLLTLLTPAESAATWHVFATVPDPEFVCVYHGPEFVACFRYDDLSEPPGSLPPILTERTFKYQLHVGGDGMALYLSTMDSFSDFHIAWTGSLVGLDCGDTVTFNFLLSSSELGGAFCTFDDTQQPIVELPPP